jgi:hypothetical protein
MTRFTAGFLTAMSIVFLGMAGAAAYLGTRRWP